jgi:hypothetical protein
VEKETWPTAVLLAVHLEISKLIPNYRQIKKGENYQKS